MKLKGITFGILLASLAGCSHHNDLTDMPTKEASLAIQLAAVSAEESITGKKTNGSVYFDCMTKNYKYGLSDEQCTKVFNVMVKKIDKQPGLSDVTYGDLTDMEFFKTIYEEYQDVMFNWLG